MVCCSTAWPTLPVAGDTKPSTISVPKAAERQAAEAEGQARAEDLSELLRPSLGQDAGGWVDASEGNPLDEAPRQLPKVNQ